jgi:hypothetical protein
LNEIRRRRGAALIVTYQELCHELAVASPGCFGELSTTGARSILRRYADAWMSTAKRRKAGDRSTRYPRRKKALVPSRYYAGTFSLEGRQLRIPVALGAPPLVVRLTREVPYPAESIRSVTVLADGARLCVDVTAELEIESYLAAEAPDPDRIAGVDLGIIHPFALVADEGSLLVSGRALRAESRLHLAESKARKRAVARRAPSKGQRGSRRWKKYRARTKVLEGRHHRRLAQARHEAPKPSSTSLERNASAPWWWETPGAFSTGTPEPARTWPPATGGWGSLSVSSETKPKRPASGSPWSTKGAARRRVRPVPRKYPSPRARTSPALTVVSSFTATWWAPSTSPRGLLGAESTPTLRSWRSRTVEPAGICPVGPGVTRDGWL